MHKAKLFGILLMLLMLTSFHSPKKKKDLWQSWSEIQELMKKEPKPIFIDMYADWCVYCKKMDVTTYVNDSVYDYLKEHFYRLKFNAESKDTLEWHHKKFGFDKKNKLHEFYLYAANGNYILPTTVIIQANGQPVSVSGEMKVKEMEAFLKYFTTEHGDISFDEFSKKYKSVWK